MFFLLKARVFIRCIEIFNRPLEIEVIHCEWISRYVTSYSW